MSLLDEHACEGLWPEDQPKPATDPWKEIELAEKYLKEKYQMDKPATVAALTFKRLEEMTEANLRLVSENAQLREQLAAFREGKARCEKQLDATMQQLAAEKADTHSALELLQKEAAAGARASEIIESLEAQLAAEREKVQTLCPNCGRPSEQCHGNCIFNNWIRAEDNPGFHRHE